MRIPDAVLAVRWLVRDTFQQAVSSYLFFLLLGVSALIILFCCSASIEGGRTMRHPEAIQLLTPDEKPLTTSPSRDRNTFGHLTLAFGALPLPLFRDAEAEVHFLQAILALWVAGAAGTLLTLIWTAGFLPEFLQPNVAAVLLAKPVPRWSLLVGKYLGVLAFVAFQACIYFGGTWLALGLRTDVWLQGYLLCIPLLLLHFAVIYSFSALLAVYTRNTVLCIIGSLLAWFGCFALNYARHANVALGADAHQPLLHAAYWVLPKPADLVMLFNGILRMNEHFPEPPALALVRKINAFEPELSLLTSFLFTGGLLALAARRFVKTDY